jgi:hypothetical protein
MKTFKKLLIRLTLPILFLGMIATVSSCSKDDAKDTVATCDTCVSTPDALAANDTSVKGVYKGVLIGSTGTISINIQNGSNTITATLVIDGVTVLLTSNVEVVNGQSYVAPFTGTYNGSSISVTLSVGSGGQSPTMTSSSIPGHPNAVFNLFKETSTSLIEAFEGTYSQPNQTGTFNIVVARSLSKWGGISKKNGTDQVNNIEGVATVNENKLFLDGNLIGTINGDEINGSFKNGDNEAVTIKGTRTL